MKALCVNGKTAVIFKNNECLSFAQEMKKLTADDAKTADYPTVTSLFRVMIHAKLADLTKGGTNV